MNVTIDRIFTRPSRTYSLLIFCTVTRVIFKNEDLIFTLMNNFSRLVISP